VSWLPTAPAVNKLPLALLEGDVFGLTRTGWTYTLILTLLTGVVAHGLFVYAQRTIQIGTIGIAQVVQPALAVVWAFMLLGEQVAPPQIWGIAIVIAGLLAFLLINERDQRARLAPLQPVISRSL